MTVKKFAHVGGTSKDTTQLTGSMRGNSGDGLGSSENNSWNAQYRYMVALGDGIDFIAGHIGEVENSEYHARKVYKHMVGLWFLLLGSPKARELSQQKKQEISTRLRTAKIYLESGNLDRLYCILEKIWETLSQILADGYTFKGSRAKVRIRSGVAGDIDDLVGRK